jgi:hypothetical protein
MINLIPPTAKKQIVAEYWVRVVSLGGFLVGSACLFSAALFIPINIYIVSQERYLSLSLSANQAEQANQIENTALLSRANQQAILLLQTKPEYTTASLLPRLQVIGGNTVILNEIALSQAPAPLLTVSGVAVTRQALVDYRDTLEAVEEYVRVDLPISNLIKDRNVPFTITITLATTTPAV